MIILLKIIILWMIIIKKSFLFKKSFFLFKKIIIFNNIMSNTNLGQNTLSKNSGINNTAIGADALANNTSASDNTSVGAYSLYSNVSGINNVAIGANALLYNTSGKNNVAVGPASLLSVESTNDNTALGANTLEYNSGGYNVALGSLAGYNDDSGSNNTYVGYNAGQLSSDLNTYYNSTLIGSNATFNPAMGQTGQIVIGSTGTNVYIPGNLIISGSTGSSGSSTSYLGAQSFTGGTSYAITNYESDGATGQTFYIGSDILGPITISSTSQKNYISGTLQLAVSSGDLAFTSINYVSATIMRDVNSNSMTGTTLQSTSVNLATGTNTDVSYVAGTGGTYLNNSLYNWAEYYSYAQPSGNVPFYSINNLTVNMMAIDENFTSTESVNYAVRINISGYGLEGDLGSIFCGNVRLSCLKIA